jgi:hypothetical protein
LLPGCYGALRLNAGSTLTLKGGGVYNFKEVRQLSGSTLRSDSPGWSAVVNVMGKYITESSVFMTDLVVNDQAGPGNNLQIGNGSIIKNVICSSPNGEIHIHTGAQLRGDSALLALTFAVQPITAEAAPPPISCECPDGSHFADDASRKCVLD